MLEKSTRSHFLWIRTHTFKFESAWMAAQRFMYLNDMNEIDFIKFIRRESSPAQSMKSEVLNSAVPWELLFLESIDVNHDFVKDFKHEISFPWAHHSRFLTDPKLPIRYCPICLQHCFHWKFFQYSAVQCCPYHHEQLLDYCSVCRHEIGTGLFISNQKNRPLTCLSCGHSFNFKKIGHQLTSGFPEAEDVFSEASSLLDRTLKAHVVGGNENDFNSKSKALSKLYFNCIYKTINGQQGLPAWLFDVVSNMRIKQHNPLKDIETIPLENEEETVEQRLIDISRIYKSVGRHLAKRVLSICGHRHHHQLNFGYEYDRISGREFFLRMRDDGCPCCAVLDWWRARLANHFGILKFLRHAGHPDRLNYFWVYSSWLASLLPITLADAAFGAISIFSSLSNRMFGFLGGKDDHATFFRDLYGDPLADIGQTNANRLIGLQFRLFERPELRLWIPRHHVGCEIIRIELDDKNSYYGFSLSSALTALRRCHQIRAKGRLWVVPTNCYDFRPLARPPKSPRWYEDFSRESNSRYWSPSATSAARVALIERDHKNLSK